MAKNITSKPTETKKTAVKKAVKKAAPKKAAKKAPSKPTKTKGLLAVEVKLISKQEQKFVNGAEIAPNYEVKPTETVETKTIEHYAVFVGEKQKTALADKNQCNAWADGIKEQQKNIYDMFVSQGKTKTEAITYTNQRYL